LKPSLKLSIILITLTFLSACAPVISRELLQQVDTTIAFKSVSEKPESYRNEMVLWGGVIVSTRNLKEGTLLEILHKPLGFGNEPKEGDNSEGRFLALSDGYLDSAVYSKDRKVTLVGVVKGRRVQLLDEVEYAYPLIAIKEIYLWPERKEVYYGPYYYDPYYYDPFPFRYPRWRHYHRW
jgi:outer membrane lipoprotein